MCSRWYSLKNLKRLSKSDLLIKNHPAEQDGFFIDQNLTGVINGERL